MHSGIAFLPQGNSTFLPWTVFAHLDFMAFISDMAVYCMAMRFGSLQFKFVETVDVLHWTHRKVNRNQVGD